MRGLVRACVVVAVLVAAVTASESARRLRERFTTQKALIAMDSEALNTVKACGSAIKGLDLSGTANTLAGGHALQHIQSVGNGDSQNTKSLFEDAAQAQTYADMVTNDGIVDTAATDNKIDIAYSAAVEEARQARSARPDRVRVAAGVTPVKGTCSAGGVTMKLAQPISVRCCLAADASTKLCTNAKRIQAGWVHWEFMTASSKTWLHTMYPCQDKACNQCV